MASSSDVVRRVLRFKLQLTDAAETATVLKILQKLKDLNITLDILAETGIGKTVNSLRRHGEAGELAKSLVRGWKKLVPKKPTGHTEDGNVSDGMSVKVKPDDQSFQKNGGLTTEDTNNNCLPSNGKSQENSTDHLLRKANTEKPGEDQKRKKDLNGKSHEFQIAKEEEKMDDSDVSNEKRNDVCNNESGDNDGGFGEKKSEDAHEKSRSDSKEQLKSSSGFGGFRSEKESGKKSKPSKESSQNNKETFSLESDKKYSKKLRPANNLDDSSSGLSRSSEPQSRKRKKREKEKHDSLKYKEKYRGYKGHSKPKNKKAKIKHEESDSEQPSKCFESCLNYDEKLSWRKERSGVKKLPKKVKKVVKEEPTKDPVKSPVMSVKLLSPKKKFKESIMDQINVPLPAVLSEWEKPYSLEYFEKKVEKETDFCDVSEESAVFTGQRLNKKMQVYSGAKTVFLPAMMSLYQQCIRTLQNNINLLHETGGVPFDILEPVLERCTPEQLLRIEECNPVYIGLTDHLWGKHCQKDFKDSKLQEYESWKEMYIRLSEERERKFQRLTKSIISAHSSKPKGRQVKMAFIHTVAKPPRNVRIQQEIHGTAVQQPLLRCSVKVQDNKPRPSNEPSRSSSISSGAINTQDPRKKTRVAPMMAKSLKAFKKQLGRR